MVLKTYSFSKKHNSTKQITNEAAVKTYNQVYLKADTDLDHPIFLIDDSFSTANYCYLQDFGRYYFIDKWVLGNKNIYELHCSIDALATYKSYVGGYTAFVERCADSNYYRDHFNDELVSVSQRVNNFDMNQTSISGLTVGGSYVLRMVGGDADGVSTFVTSDLSTFAAIFDKDTYNYSSETSFFQEMLNTVFDPYDYVVSLCWSPLDVSVYTANGGYAANIWCKWYDTQILCTKLPNHKQIYLNSGDLAAPASLYGDFRKLNPNFTRYRIQVPGVGLIDLDNNEAQGGLRVAYTIQLDSGAAQVDILRSSDLTHVANFTTNLYTPLQVGNDNWSIGTIASNIASSAASFISGNVVSGAASAVAAVGNIIQPTPTTLGGMGGIGLAADPYVYFISECYGSGAIPTTVAGRPCYQNLLISNLSGFIKCGNASIEAPCNEDVKSMLNDYLNNGFYYE